MFNDPISQRRLTTLHPWLKAQALAAIDEAWRKGLRFRITQAFRTPQEQQAIYDQGRTKAGKIVTDCPPWKSWHNYGLAFDVALMGENGDVIWDRNADLNDDHKADLMQFADIAKKHGFSWGGDWKIKKDYPHFEQVPRGMTTSKAKALAINGKTDKGGYIKW